MIALVSEAGYRKAISRVCQDDVPDIITTLITYNLFIKVKAHMDQFREGLDNFGVGSYISKYYNLLRPLFVDENVRLTSSKYIKRT